MVMGLWWGGGGTTVTTAITTDRTGRWGGGLEGLFGEDFDLEGSGFLKKLPQDFG
jgi:hypothetical protein